MEDSYLLLVHLFCSTKKEHTGILKSHIKDGTEFTESIIETPDGQFGNCIFRAFILRLTSDNSDSDAVSRLMDIDSHTMTEVIIYNTAGNLYADMLYSVELSGSRNIRSQDLFTVHKTNRYFLQKTMLKELSFNENVNSFITKQRRIEKFECRKKISSTCTMTSKQTKNRSQTASFNKF